MLAEIDQDLNNARPTLAHLGIILVDVEQILGDLDQIRSVWARLCQLLVNLDKDLATTAEFGRDSPNVSQHGPTLAQNVAQIGHIGSRLGQISTPGATCRQLLGKCGARWDHRGYLSGTRGRTTFAQLSRNSILSAPLASPGTPPSHYDSSLRLIGGQASWVSREQRPEGVTKKRTSRGKMTTALLTSTADSISS